MIKPALHDTPPKRTREQVLARLMWAQLEELQAEVEALMSPDSTTSAHAQLWAMVYNHVVDVRRLARQRMHPEDRRRT